MDKIGELYRILGITQPEYSGDWEVSKLQVETLRDFRD